MSESINKNLKIVKFLKNKGYSYEYIKNNREYFADIDDPNWGGNDNVPKPTKLELEKITNEEAEDAIVEEQLIHKEEKLDSKMTIYLVERLYKQLRPKLDNNDVKDEIKQWIRQGLRSGKF